MYNNWDKGHLGWVMKHRRVEETTTVMGVKTTVVRYEKIEDMDGLNIVRRKLEMLSEVYDFLSNQWICHRQALMRLLESGAECRCEGKCDICSRPTDQTLQNFDAREACQDIWMIVDSICKQENKSSAAFTNIKKLWQDTDLFGFLQSAGRRGPQTYCVPWKKNEQMLRAVIGHMVSTRMLLKVYGEFTKGKTLPPVYVFYVGYVSPVKVFPDKLPPQLVLPVWTDRVGTQ
jgi:hypothetical protein